MNKLHYPLYTEQQVWDELTRQGSLGPAWMLDKLMLARYLGYTAGPAGVDVPKPGQYIVRPATNAYGCGIHTELMYIDKSTDHLDPGTFWCEYFEGHHLSVDYDNEKPVLAVEGFRDKTDFTKFLIWQKVHPAMLPVGALPGNLFQLITRTWRFYNVEWIGDKIIEVHFRWNPDFKPLMWDTFIPVYEGETTGVQRTFIASPDVNGRVGAIVQ